MTKQQLTAIRDKITPILQNHLSKEESIERANNITQFFSAPTDDLTKDEVIEEISFFPISFFSKNWNS